MVACVYNEKSEEKFKRSGADRTMSPYKIGGSRLAMLTVRPIVVDFLDRALNTGDADLNLEDLEVCQGSPMAGLTLKEWLMKSSGLHILAVRKKGHNLQTDASPETKIEVGDELVVIGTREQLRVIERSCSPF